MAAAQPPPPAGSWATIPRPIRHLFDLFPLTTLPAEPLPARAPPRSRARPALYVFGRGDPSAGRPSFNPSCLKWQPLTGTQIARYARAHSPCAADIPQDPARAEPYSALIAQRIRPAWLYTLYLLPANFPLLSALYLPPSPLIALPTLHSLRRAAAAEILSTTRRPALSPPTLLADARDALAAIAALLADDEWFFSAPAPGLFDAEVFAYTHLVLDDGIGWADDELARCVAAFDNLVRHRDRLYRRCWPE
ncbi:Metaxin-1 [Escovopsis weberi]|uniref:Metaxin-1 n=1 Tax=Escovopsis weberi TaxID=150374 RepID=A0A0M8N7K6_ESCWE|nr:Metaxin-1 [Escovopsis weberi]